MLYNGLSHRCRNAGSPSYPWSRHGDETLRRFLEEVSEGLPDLILQSAEKRLKAIQQLEENLSTFVEELRFFRNGGRSDKKN